MIRKAFKLKVNQGCFAEYKKRHDNIFPDLVEVLKEAGAQNYSIFLDEETGCLFGYVELDCLERWNAVSKTEACQKWWKYMDDIMETNADMSPKSTELKEMFYLE
ncbi:L-rhamnose mutarotase [Photobacterium sp. DNB23_23_1]|uniref:L-rhamnose mutarotase n=1 Tax=Photobacterium pectinilyticum TaxID=2906793 RepID=A0ABT1N572_9GAMM|nr:L-rhamnose mutarotase [Photobacterium sp. ZSDE20]MCQ1059900.1 L-rhamnose mutarotase [Photobacterium sp. ZSDE20]MDD1826089.1 L-rhamnose mutarotase [Photobacterium sp. ZSDE20]